MVTSTRELIICALCCNRLGLALMLKDISAPEMVFYFTSNLTNAHACFGLLGFKLCC